MNNRNLCLTGSGGWEDQDHVLADLEPGEDPFPTDGNFCYVLMWREEAASQGLLDKDPNFINENSAPMTLNLGGHKHSDHSKCSRSFPITWDRTWGFFWENKHF
jgi:hypothetical protein